MIMNLKNVTRNFDFDFFQTIPLRSNEQAPTSLTRFREYLLGSHRLSEARAVLDVELGICTKNSDQLTACGSVLEVCSVPAARDPIWLIVGRARMRLATILRLANKSEEARQQLDSAWQWFSVASTAGKSNRIDLLCRLQELKDFSPPNEAGLIVNDSSLLERYESFSNDRLVQNDSFVMSTALCRGIDVAIAILEKNTSNFNKDVFWKWSKRTEAILEELGDIARLFINRCATGDIACTLFSDFGSLIKWHKDFDERYPTFHLWRQKISLSKTLARIYSQIKYEDRAMETVKKMETISASQDIFWQAEGFRTQSEVASQSMSNKIDDNLLPLAFQGDYKELDWLLHDSKSLPIHSKVMWNRLRIKDDGSTYEDISKDVEGLLLEYMKDDFAAGILSSDDLKILCRDLLVEAKPISKSPSLDPSGAQNATAASFTWAIKSLEESMSPSKFLGSLSPETVSTMLYGTVDSPTPDQQWEQMFETLSRWLLKESLKPEKKRHYLLYQIQNTRKNSMSYPKSSFESQIIESQRMIDLIPCFNPTVREQVSSNISGLITLIASSKYAIYLNKNGSPFSDIECSEFQELIQLYNESLEKNHGNGRFVREAQTHVAMAQLHFFAALKLNQQALNGFFQSMLNALAALEKLRDGWRTQQGWERVQNLIHTLKDPYIMSIIPWAVTVYTQYRDSEADFRASMIWSMVQMAKSLGLGWLMEISASIARESQENSKIATEDAPSEDTVRRVDSARQPLQTDKDDSFEAGHEKVSHDPKRGAIESEQVNERGNNLEDDQNYSTSGSPAINGEEEGTEKSDKKNNSYTILEDLEAQLRQLSNVGGDIVFVDWYNSTSSLQSFVKPLITSIAPGERPKCCLADITWQTVDETVQKFIDLDTDDLQSKKKSKILYKLNPLVEPLKHLSKPGQVLVLLPFGSLNRIPLHALKLDGEVLIHRNPIVYCSSLSALTVAFESRQEKEKSATTPSSSQPLSVKASIYGDPPSDVGKKALHATAAVLGVQQAHIEEQFRSSLFVQTIQDPSLHILHYHGHANFSASSPFDQSFSFKDHHLNVREIFDIIPGRRAFHATLLGCGSGASKTEITNDVLGLVPAMLHAGAASTVSSLWTFADKDAALYQEYFYEEFAKKEDDGEEEAALERGVGGIEISQEESEEGRAGGKGFEWNLAVANQRAVLKIMEQKPALYHWAGFVLNGWWMMHVPGRPRRRT